MKSPKLKTFPFCNQEEMITKRESWPLRFCIWHFCESLGTSIDVFGRTPAAVARKWNRRAK